ncbi:MAG: LCP family protein, partial [Coriobacteriales bacterium]|nr:LCP family protein [Coriobacteriales bacterium]
MATGAISKKKSRKKPSEVNLIAARSAVYSDVTDLSRELSAEHYTKIRAKRQRNKIVTRILSVVLAAALLAVGTAASAYKLVLEPHWDSQLIIRPDGTIQDLKGEAFSGVFVAPEKPMDPFFMLLLGLDSYESVSRTDTIILVYVDPGLKKIAMISIPRDIRVSLPGYGNDKINAAYVYGEMEHSRYLNGYRSEDTSGVSFAADAVSEFAGVDIAYFVVINFDGFKTMVDSIGGVYVDVPFAIDDYQAGPSILSPGGQVLDGEQALTFVRTRSYGLYDYQRQANQRTFLQALAKQTLNSDPATIVSTVDAITRVVYSNMTTNDILSLAMTFRGIHEYDIHTYTVPAYSQDIDGISFEIVRQSSWNTLITAVARGEFPSFEDIDLAPAFGGITPDSYKPDGTVDDNGGILSREQCSEFVVDVRNGWGTKGAAKAVSDMLNLAGYQQGEIGNTNTFVYTE